MSIISFYIASFFVPGSFDGFNFYGNFDNANIYYQIFSRLSIASYFGGWVPFIFAYELNLKHTRYFISLTLTFFIILLFLINPLNYTLILLIFLIYGTAFWVILILYTRWSELEYKAVSLYILAGIILFANGLIWTLTKIKQMNVFPPWLSSLLIFLGTLLYISPLLFSSTDYNRVFKRWVIIGAFLIIFYIMVITFYLVYNFPIEYIIGDTYYALFIVYLEYYMLKHLQTSSSVPDPSKSQVNFLSSLTRPQKLTEEEVSISKERKICLVCKNKVGGFNFICKDCGAFYCENCAKTLIGIENACWVCESPFDETKPVKLPEIKEEQEEIVVEETHKKGK